MKNNLKIFLLSSMAMLIASPVMAATKANVNTSRVFEDGIWAVVFIIVIMFAMAMAKAMKGGMKNVSMGYTILLVSGITGFLWKFLGVLMRGFGIKKPDWLFSLVRESLEGATGLLFAVAFIVLFVAITKKKD